MLARPGSTRPTAIVQRVADAIEGRRSWSTFRARTTWCSTRKSTRSIAEVARFLTGEAKVPPPSRSLCAVLFTDLVSSTERAAALGDERWKQVLNRHDAVARTAIGRGVGRVVKTTGDGVLAVLPSASAGLQAAHEIRRLLDLEGLEVRIGLHVAEVEPAGTTLPGSACTSRRGS